MRAAEPVMSATGGVAVAIVWGSLGIMGQILFLAGDLDVVATAINGKTEVGTRVWSECTHRVPRPDQGGVRI